MAIESRPASPESGVGITLRIDEGAAKQVFEICWGDLTSRCPIANQSLPDGGLEAVPGSVRVFVTFGLLQTLGRVAALSYFVYIYRRMIAFYRHRRYVSLPAAW